ncbi:hypothetical protein ROJ8625_04076 [Roseivivax jejudonensis]|uniref:Uncharacterized protein n=1 Tax=Roseivivax jejudonensis TaxID=1529041 RepID=A0A1X7ABG6_9RHOB|nr:hypothetical protein [Roseivivax jejudonensis]SLN74660.1 hypothetical protein ROJ8625_04076 [Roseivivax jejudonensis]
MTRCNVRIEDQHFHEMHHALGNPWPDEIAGETYRNYFATDADSDTADRMRASSHWTNGSAKFGMIYFHVTDEGRRALLKFMRDHVAIPARYIVTYRHHNGSSVVAAKNRSAARYAAYQHADVDWPFMEFAANIRSITLYAPALTPA